jgi:flagellar hook-basal body complex protein FliE
MEGFTVSNANRFLDTGVVRDSKSMNIEKPSSVGSTADSDKSFATTLKEAISNVNELQQSSDAATQALATGKTDDVASVMIASQKADIALHAMVQVRNKIIDAYQEIMKMQV